MNTFDIIIRINAYIWLALLTMKKIQTFFEERAFGVCAFLGEKLGVATSAIRLFFLYASFLTFGSPLIIYLVLAFLLNIHKYLRRKRSTVWDF